MKADVGDRIVIEGHQMEEAERDGEILEVHGRDSGPPFLVRWGHTGHESPFFAGPDASVQPFSVAG
jgi:hypothetical protein